MLSAEGISYGTRDREILYEISLRAEAGEFVGIIGPNGSGKSTLLKNLYKVLRPRAGRAFLMGEDLLAMSGREMAQRLAVVVQEHESGFDFTVEEVVRMGRHARKGLLEADNGQDRSLVDRVLRLTSWRRCGSRATPPCPAGRSSGYSSPGPWSRTPPA